MSALLAWTQIFLILLLLIQKVLHQVSCRSARLPQMVYLCLKKLTLLLHVALGFCLDYIFSGILCIGKE